MTALAIAGGLLYTQLATITMPMNGERTATTLLQFQNAGNPVDFLGIPVVLQSYRSTVLPIIIAVWLASYVEKFFNKIIHESLRNFITPLMVLVIMVPLTLLTIGPAGVWLGRAIASGLLWVYNLAPWLAEGLLGGVWQVMVIFGVHWGLAPVFINNVTELGYDLLKAAVFPAVLGQAGAALGVFLKLKSPKAKAIAGSAALSGIFGITEPAIYGVNLPRKRPFIAGIVGGVLGGILCGAMQVKIYGTGAASVLTLPIGFGDPMGFGSTFHWLVIATAIGFFTGLLGTFFFGISREELVKDREQALLEKEHARHGDKVSGGAAAAYAATTAAGAVEGSVATLSDVDTEVLVPVAGTVIPLAEVSDKVFASGAMGPGFAVIPDDGAIVAPISGTVLVSMGHAFGIKSASGVEVLVHVGIDTVQLKGAPFSHVVAQGTQVRAGDPLAVADLNAIDAAGLDNTTVVVVTNASRFAKVEVLAEGPASMRNTGLVVVN